MKMSIFILWNSGLSSFIIQSRVQIPVLDSSCIKKGTKINLWKQNDHELNQSYKNKLKRNILYA